MDVSIIIVNYNTKQLLKDCLNSIYEHTKDINFEIIVSDNGSKDGSIEMLKTEFPQVILIENNANLGFGKANNRGLEIAKGEFVFYLNSDTLLNNNALKIFYDYWKKHENENLGALGCNLRASDGSYAASYNKFNSLEYPNKYIFNFFLVVLRVYYRYILYKFFHYKFKIFTNPKSKFIGDVDFIVGADLFIKNNEFAKFDENIFMYQDEVDLQYNMKINNLIRRLIDGPNITHLEGCSNKTNKISYEVLNMGSFMEINSKINIIYLLKKYKKINFIQSGWLKFLTLVLWINPLLYKNTKFYIKEMLKR